MSLRFKTSAGDWGGWVNSGKNGRVRQRTLDHQERVILKNLRQEKMAYLVGRMSKTSAADWGGWVNSGQIGAKSSAGDWVIVSKEANGSLTLSRL